MSAEDIRQREVDGHNGIVYEVYSSEKVYGRVDIESGNYHPPTFAKDVRGSGGKISHLVDYLLSQCRHSVDSEDLV
jgi:hypothetical protein